MKKTLILSIFATLPLCGCSTIADHLAEALEPHLERLVDVQIEREERRTGVWGTTNSYFHVKAEAEKAAAEERKESLLAAVSDLVAKNQDRILAEAEKLVEKQLEGK